MKDALCSYEGSSVKWKVGFPVCKSPPPPGSKERDNGRRVCLRHFFSVGFPTIEEPSHGKSFYKPICTRIQEEYDPVDEEPRTQEPRALATFSLVQSARI